MLKLSISVVICTKDREKSLVRAIDSLLIQTRLPEEIVIVDDGQLPSYFYEQNINQHNIKYQYIKKEKPGVALSRNLSVKTIDSDIVLVIDDDVVWDRDYIKSIMDISEFNDTNTIAGVTGVLRVSYTPGILTFLKFFCLDGSRSGKVLASGSGVLVRENSIQEPVDVQWLPGFNMSYRKYIFTQFLFDPSFSGNGWGGEDRDFSYRVSKKYKLVATPHARLVHLKDTTSRVNNRRFGYMETNFFYRFFYKNMPKLPVNYLAITWAITGILVKNLLLIITNPCQERANQLLGNIEGCLAIFAGKIGDPS